MELNENLSKHSFIDSHAHLDVYNPHDLPGVLQRMRNTDTYAITMGTHAGDWPTIRALAQQVPDLLSYAIGLHPSEVKPDWQAQLSLLEKILSETTKAAKNAPVAIGECGLDYYKLEEHPNPREFVENQKKAFAAQLSIIKSCGLPVVIHSRGEGAFAEILSAIDTSRVDWTKVVFHCFSEGPSEIRELNARGGRGSFTGIITFKNGQKAREALLAQDPGLLMIETDSPFLSPEPYRGQPNEPARVGLVAAKVAGLLGIPMKNLAVQLRTATENFFELKR